MRKTPCGNSIVGIGAALRIFKSVVRENERNQRKMSKNEKMRRKMKTYKCVGCGKEYTDDMVGEPCEDCGEEIAEFDDEEFNEFDLGYEDDSEDGEI